MSLRKDVAQQVTWSGATSASLGASVSSDPVRVGHFDVYSLQATWSGGGSPTGSLKLQASNDPTTGTPASWADVNSSSQSITTSGNYLWEVSVATYRWVRLVWTRSSGTDTIVANVNGRVNAGEAYPSA